MPDPDLFSTSLPHSHMLYILPQGTQIFWQSKSYLNLPHARDVKWGKLHTEDQTLLGAYTYTV
jgi:hypothetical protein